MSGTDGSFFEPNWETGVHVRWAIGMRDQASFSVTGLWRAKEDKNSGTLTHSFTQLTINADDHLVMDHFHCPSQEKRSLVIVPEADYEDWLDCRDPELARAYVNLYPSKLMAAEPPPN